MQGVLWRSSLCVYETRWVWQTRSRKGVVVTCCCSLFCLLVGRWPVQHHLLWKITFCLICWTAVMEPTLQKRVWPWLKGSLSKIRIVCVRGVRLLWVIEYTAGTQGDAAFLWALQEGFSFAKLLTWKLKHHVVQALSCFKICLYRSLLWTVHLDLIATLTPWTVYLCLLCHTLFVCSKLYSQDYKEKNPSLLKQLGIRCLERAVLYSINFSCQKGNFVGMAAGHCFLTVLSVWL